MNEQELKEKLHSTLVSKSKINDICEDLQIKYTEQINRYNHVVSLTKELLEANIKLRSIIESERKSYAEFKDSLVAFSPEDIKRMEKAIDDTKRIISDCQPFD